MSHSICCCGAEAGYPHSPSCPFPLYRADRDRELRWSERRVLLGLCRAHDEADGALCIRDPEQPSVCAVCRCGIDACGVPS
jgi:hypothetical protein